MNNAETRTMSPMIVKPARVIIDFGLCVLVCLPSILLTSIGVPFHRGFYCDDDSIRYPYSDSTVPLWMAAVFGISVPIISMIMTESFRVLKFEPRFYKRQWMEPQHQFLGKNVHPIVSNLYIYVGYFLFGAAICQGLTDLSKYTVGRLRPHFYQVCQPAVDCQNWPPHHYVMEPNCNTTDLATLNNARLSFLSGHSSLAAYSMFFLVLYIQARLVWPMVSLLVKHVLQCICIGLAVACGLSRISDYHHHWSDVLAGLVLGVLVACFTTFHMLGLFRQPHFIFSAPSYLSAPNADYSFGGDHIHNWTEIRYVAQRFQEQSVSLNGLGQAPQTTRGVLHHRNEVHPV